MHGISVTGMLCCEGGGGPKAALLEKMIAEAQLEHRVHMVGAVPHEQARDVLVCSRRPDHCHTCWCLIHHTHCCCDHHHAFPGHLHQASTTLPQMKPCWAVIPQFSTVIQQLNPLIERGSSVEVVRAVIAFVCLGVISDFIALVSLVVYPCEPIMCTALRV